MKIARVFFALFLATWATSAALAELRVPGNTAYLEAKPAIAWFGELKRAGKFEASVVFKRAKGLPSKLRLTIGEESREAEVSESDETAIAKFGTFAIAKLGYARFEMSSSNGDKIRLGDVEALVLDGEALEGAHFNLDPRRNAASVHLSFAPPAKSEVALFYNEVTAVTDPVASYYMATGFSRGYFGMQVNSPTERRIIFSVWDSGAGASADNRKDVPEENRVTLLAKGEGVVAHAFGGEGTGGHSHLVYPWKTGEPQKFVVTAKPHGEQTDYTGFWFHPEAKKWQLIATFRAPHDGKWLRGLYSFNENFDGSNGHLQRKALFGPQWIQTSDGKWHELSEAAFSCDATGRANRLDRFMGVENGRFFLSNGGFLPGFTKPGEKFTRPATEHPELELPAVTAEK